MFKVCKNSRLYTIDVVCRKQRIAARLDTGAVMSTIAFSDACLFLGCEREQLLETLRPSLNQHVIDANGVEHAAAFCSFSGVVIGTVHFDKFYALVSPDISYSLLGYDFVNACELKKGVGVDFSVSDFSKYTYEACTLRAVRVEPVTLLSLGFSQDAQQHSAEVLWFVGLSNEDRQQLADYSPVLYAQLTRGVFTEDLRILLDGFKNLYDL